MSHQNAKENWVLSKLKYLARNYLRVMHYCKVRNSKDSLLVSMVGSINERMMIMEVKLYCLSE